MRLLFLFYFIGIYFSSSAQVITASLEERSKNLIHQKNLWTREKNGFQVGDHVIQIEKGPNKIATVLTRLDGVTFSLDIRKIDRQGNIVTKHSPENGERVFGPLNAIPIEFGGRILLFYDRYLGKDSIKVFMSEVDKNNLQLINTRQLFSYQQDNVGFIKILEMEDRKIQIRLSEDRSFLFCVVRGKEGRFFTCVLDSNLNIVRSKVYDLPDVKKLSITSICIDNKGNSFAAFSETFKYQPVFNSRPSNDEGINGIQKIFERVETRKILVQTFDNKEKLTSVDALGIGILYNAKFHPSKDESRVFAFGDYAGLSGAAGVWLAEIPTGKSAIAKPKLHPYPKAFTKRIHELGFGSRRKGEFDIRPFEYQMVEFENGDLALGGSPILRNERSVPSKDLKSNKVDVDYFSGPIIIGFINDRSEPVFTAIPRAQEFSAGSQAILVPYNDKLVVIYNDTEKNINDADIDMDKLKLSARPSELALGAAVLDKSGKILSKKVLVEGISRRNYFNTSDYEPLSAKKMLILPFSPEKNDADTRAAVVSVE